MISQKLLAGIITLGLTVVYIIYILIVRMCIHYKSNPNEIPSEYFERRKRVQKVENSNDVETVSIEENSKNVSKVEVDIVEPSVSKNSQNCELTKMLSNALSIPHRPLSYSSYPPTIVNIPEDVPEIKSNKEHENSSDSSDITLVFDIPNNIYSQS